jgi:hypothetical protein
MIYKYVLGDIKHKSYCIWFNADITGNVTPSDRFIYSVNNNNTILCFSLIELYLLKNWKIHHLQGESRGLVDTQIAYMHYNCQMIN